MKKNILHGLISIALLGTASSVAATAQEGLPPRNQDMMRDAIELASVLGKVHAVRIACNGRGDQYWREKMFEMLNMEAPAQSGFRRSMARAFNDSYSREAARWPVCDTTTVAAEAAYAEEGRRLADRMAMHYFPR